MTTTNKIIAVTMSWPRGTTNKTTTITMSDRAPIKIVSADWLTIASAHWFSGQIECQANEEAYLRVLEHEDGRRIVYGDRDRGPGGMAVSYRGKAAGYLVDTRQSDYSPGKVADQEGTIRAIRRAAGVIDRPELGDACIADLPAEELS